MHRIIAQLALVIVALVSILYWKFIYNAPLAQAERALAHHQYEKCLELLAAPYEQASHEAKRRMLRGVALTWLEEWDQAAHEFNALAALRTEPIDVAFITPVNLKEGTIREEFLAPEYTYDDVLYLWRVLWQERIAQRLIHGRRDQMERAVIIMDYVFRHGKFGTFEGGHLADKPFNVLIKGQGFCEELAWISNSLLRAAGLDALRLLLYHPEGGESCHTIGLVKIGRDWIAYDPSVGLILKGTESGEPRTFPPNFVLNPTSDIKKLLGRSLLHPFEPYCDKIKAFGHYDEFYTTIPYSHPFVDYEMEAAMPRILWLADQLKKIQRIPTLAQMYMETSLPVLDEETQKICNWNSIFVDYIYASTHRINAARRRDSAVRFAYLEPLRYARLDMFKGDLTAAEEKFLKLSSSDQLWREAREDIAYYLGVIAYEQAAYPTAHERFRAFLEKYPQSMWKERALYQLALIAQAQGEEAEAAQLIQECGQDSEASFFHWMVKLDLV